MKAHLRSLAGLVSTCQVHIAVRTHVISVLIVSFVVADPLATPSSIICWYCCRFRSRRAGSRNPPPDCEGAGREGACWERGLAGGGGGCCCKRAPSSRLGQGCSSDDAVLAGRGGGSSDGVRSLPKARALTPPPPARLLAAENDGAEEELPLHLSATIALCLPTPPPPPQAPVSSAAALTQTS